MLLAGLSLFVAATCTLAYPKDADVKVRNVRQVNPTVALTQRSFNFASVCPPGIVLTLGAKTINRANLRFSSADAVSIM